jgi:DNA repair protein RecO (recombination protein O)
MAEIIRTEGIVLKRRDFSESSRIAVVYTRAAGKVQLLAKGARSPRARFGAALEPLSRGEFVFYWREGKDLLTLTEAMITHAARFLRDEPKALPYGLAAAEALDKLSGEGDADAARFELLASALAALDAGGPAGAVLAQFLLRLASNLGLKPNLAACAACGRARLHEGAALLLKDGAVVCRACVPAAARSVQLSPGAYNYLNTLMSIKPSLLGRVKASPELVEGALAFILGHLSYHTGLEIKSLKFAHL